MTLLPQCWKPRKEPIQFCSRKLSDVERKYDIVEKEALAIYWGIKRLRPFLIGNKFVERTDHCLLKFIFNSSKCSPKVIRWQMELQENDFPVEYCRGSENPEGTV